MSARQETPAGNGNLYQLFQSRFPADHARVFIEMEDGGVYSYGDLEDISGRYARLLTDLGAAGGERVAVQVEKSPESIFLYLACLRAGAIYLPLNPAYTTAEVEYFLGDAEPKVVVCRPETEDAIREIAGAAQILTLNREGGGSLPERAHGLSRLEAYAAAKPDDIAALLYTSGTTGRSKGAMMTHRNLGSNGLALHELWGFEPNDVLLHALPLFHTHGLFVATHCVLLNGSAMVFLPKFDADTVLRLLPRATVMMGVPTFYTRLLADPGLNEQACRNMRLFISGSAPLLEETFRAFKTRTGHAILERYGMTETGMITSNPLNGERIAGTVGLPLPEVEVRVRDDDAKLLGAEEIGGIEVRGPNVFSGYWRMPEKTKAEIRPDGFFITGDVGKIDVKGTVHIVGRAKDLIICGGFNVYPKEVELCIDRIAGVTESAVIGVPHDDFGEAVVAIIKRDPNRNGLTVETVIAACKAELANFKVPKQVHFVDNLPRNAMGKVQKNELRTRYQTA